MTLIQRIRNRRSATVQRRAFYLENVLGTSLELHVVANAEGGAEQARDAVLNEVDRLSAIFNSYSADSELSRWERTCDEDVSVSPELFDVLSMADNWRDWTHDAFNPAVRALVAELESPLCDPARLNVLTELVGGVHWSLDHFRQTARRLSDLPLSFDGIAKGYIVSEAAKVGRSVRGVRELLLNIGGDLHHLGEKPAAVAIVDPFNPAENTKPIATVALGAEALATSGGYRRSIATSDGTRSHIIDPRTAEAVEEVVSVSVISPNGATADALSTSFSVLGPVQSLPIADALAGVGVLIVCADGSIVTNDAWRERQLSS